LRLSSSTNGLNVGIGVGGPALPGALFESILEVQLSAFFLAVSASETVQVVALSLPEWMMWNRYSGWNRAFLFFAGS
jgi:hypothetical protein